MNALKNTIKRPFGHKGVKSLPGCKIKTIGANILNAAFGSSLKKCVHNALQDNDLLFEHAGIVIGHKESSFHGVCKRMMDVAGGGRNAATCNLAGCA